MLTCRVVVKHQASFHPEFQVCLMRTKETTSGATQLLVFNPIQVFVHPAVKEDYV